MKQTAINTRSELPPTHLGWNGRLAGPADNPVSSCMSCHMTADYPQLAPLNPTSQADPPPVGSPAWMRWFQNEPAGEPFSGGAQSTDYSLQLTVSMQNFYSWKCDQGGVFADGGNACQKAGLKLMLKRESLQKCSRFCGIRRWASWNRAQEKGTEPSVPFLVQNDRSERAVEYTVAF